MGEPFFHIGCHTSFISFPKVSGESVSIPVVSLSLVMRSRDVGKRSLSDLRMRVAAGMM